MKYILLLLFIAFAGLKSKPDIQPCTSKIEQRFYYRGKPVDIDVADLWITTNEGQSYYIHSGKRKIKADSVIYKMYQPPTPVRFNKLIKMDQ